MRSVEYNEQKLRIDHYKEFGMTIFRIFMVTFLLFAGIHPESIYADIIQKTSITSIDKLPESRRIFKSNDVFSYSFTVSETTGHVDFIDLSCGSLCLDSNGNISSFYGGIEVEYTDGNWKSTGLSDCFAEDSVKVSVQNNKYTVSAVVKKGNTVLLSAYKLSVGINGLNTVYYLDTLDPPTTYYFSDKCAIGNHTYYSDSEKTVDSYPTCKENGSKSIKCIICDSVVPETIEIIPATGDHSWNYYGHIKLPNCKEEGIDKYVCSYCGEEKEVSVPKTENHQMGELVTFVEGSCKTDEIVGRICSVCGYKDEINNGKKDHSWNDWIVTKEPTINKKGISTRTCSTCGKTETTTIPKLKPIPATITLTVSPSKTIAAGKKVTIVSSVTPEQDLTWKSSNKKYATVSSKGIVTTKKAGAGKSVVITVQAKDGTKKNVRINIVKDGVKKIELSGKTELKAGRQCTIKATVTAGKTANTVLKWSSSNTDFATVNKKGIVTTKEAGKGKTVTITATATDGTGIKGRIKIKLK